MVRGGGGGGVKRPSDSNARNLAEHSTYLNKISPQARDIAVALINVCGLKTRIKNAEFSEYINKFDIIILT